MARAAFRAVRTHVIVTGAMAAAEGRAETARGGLGDVAEQGPDGRETGADDCQADLAGCAVRRADEAV